MSTTPFITRQNGTTRKIQDLSWLLRAAKRIEQFVITSIGETDGNGDNGCKLQAILAETDKVQMFTVEFASVKLCKIWLNRPRFYGKMIVQDGVNLGPVSKNETKYLR